MFPHGNFPQKPTKREGVEKNVYFEHWGFKAHTRLKCKKTCLHWDITDIERVLVETIKVHDRLLKSIGSIQAKFKCIYIYVGT